MNNWKCAITLATCCCIVLTIAPSASADFVGVTTVIKDDPDTAFLCTQGHGQFVPGPLTVCNVYAVFNDPADRLFGVAEADLQVYNGAAPDVFFQHPVQNDANVDRAPNCGQIDPIFGFPDLICDTYYTIGLKCSTVPPGDNTFSDPSFNAEHFRDDGHIHGGWAATPYADGRSQGDAGDYPDLQVLFLQSSVAQGLSMSGVIHIIWEDGDTGDFIIEHDVPIECAAVEQDPCECVNGKVTLCHIPQGNLDNARTITVGCAARDKHLAHGDFCGPCE